MSSCSSIFSNLNFTKSSSSSTASTIPSVGSTMSSKSLAFPNRLEICQTFLFHVSNTLTSEALCFGGNSILTTILSILLPSVLTFELRRTRLVTIPVKTFHIGILHEFLELPSDVESSSSEDSSVSLLLAFSAISYFWFLSQVQSNPIHRFASFQSTLSKEQSQYPLILQWQ